MHLFNLGIGYRDLAFDKNDKRQCSYIHFYIVYLEFVVHLYVNCFYIQT